MDFPFLWVVMIVWVLFFSTCMLPDGVAHISHPQSRFCPNSEDLVWRLLRPGTWRLREVVRLSMWDYRVRTTSLAEYLETLRQDFEAAQPCLHICNDRVYVLDKLLVVPLSLFTDDELGLLELALLQEEVVVQETPFDLHESTTLPLPQLSIDRGLLLKMACVALVTLLEALVGKTRETRYARAEVCFFVAHRVGVLLLYE